MADRIITLNILACRKFHHIQGAIKARNLFLETNRTVEVKPATMHPQERDHSYSSVQNVLSCF
jgi:hypothetical protein